MPRFKTPTGERVAVEDGIVVQEISDKHSQVIIAGHSVTVEGSFDDVTGEMGFPKEKKARGE